MSKKNNSTGYIVGTVFVIGLVALLVWLGIGGNSMTYSASALTVTEKSFDFDTISMEEGKVYHKFELKNEGIESVSIIKAYTSCMCTEVLITNEAGDERGPFGMQGHGIASTNLEVGVGESVTVEAIFDPAAHGPSGVGFAERSIYLETNSSVEPKVELTFQAMVTQ
ncbi:MAG: DUF1573 domain-containing protein [Parcubacteria group bacterium]